MIELDGTQHYLEDGLKQDEIRRKALESKGLLLLRFSNREIDREFDAVCEMIHQVITKRKEQLL